MNRARIKRLRKAAQVNLKALDRNYREPIRGWNQQTWKAVYVHYTRTELYLKKLKK